MFCLFSDTLKVNHNIIDKENPITDRRYIKEQLMIIISEYWASITLKIITKNS